MKICLVTSMHDWHDDRIFQRLAVGLVKLGHEVVYIAPAENDFESEGVRILAIKQRSRYAKHIFGPSDAYEKMKGVNADLYHFFNPNLMFKMKSWSKKGQNVFIDIHENYEARVDSWLLPPFLKPIAIKTYRRIENFLCRSFNGITVVTETMKKKLSTSNSPIFILDNVPYLKKLDKVELATIKHERPTIITSGTHSKQRNVIETINAIPLIKKEIPNVLVKFVGRYQPKEFEFEILQRAKELNVENNVVTEGMMPWLENFNRISKAHVGCVFYQDNLNNRVTLPNRLYEYMFSNLAVIGENFPEVKKVIEVADCGYVVDSKDPVSIADAAIKLLTDNNVLMRKISNAKNAINNRYNFDDAVIKLDKFYKENLN